MVGSSFEAVRAVASALAGNLPYGLTFTYHGNLPLQDPRHARWHEKCLQTVGSIILGQSSARADRASYRRASRSSLYGPFPPFLSAFTLAPSQAPARVALSGVSPRRAFLPAPFASLFSPPPVWSEKSQQYQHPFNAPTLARPLLIPIVEVPFKLA